LKDKLRLQQAYVTAKMSSCISRQVGAIITVNDRIVAEGYNGTPKGYSNCNTINPIYNSSHHEWSNFHEIHAEMNAIIWAARKGVSIEGGVLYSTTKPCLQCTKNIIASGIVKIVYCEKYPLNDDKIIDEFLAVMGVEVIQIDL
jgi:dCMP deaminase